MEPVSLWIVVVVVALAIAFDYMNGFHDAANSIASIVSTGVLRPSQAVVFAAFFNLLAVFVFHRSVAATIGKGIVQPEVVDVPVVFGALAGAIVWNVLTWYFGIPTSESHALIAGLTGSAIALHGGLGGVNGQAWLKVIYGLVISVVLGFVLGYAICKLVTVLFFHVDRRKTEGIFRYGQIGAACAMSFMHGAQDGQKFMGVILMCLLMSNGGSESNAVQMPVWIMLLCSVIMSVGTSIGGKKIIKSIGMDMVKLEKYQGFSADLAASASLLISSLFGIPVSTTHAKTTAIMGVGAVKRPSAVNLGVVKNLVMTWVLTFPGCGVIGFITTKIFMAIF